MSKRKTRIIQYVLYALMALVVLLSVVATYAYYSDRRDYSSSLTFGNIQIDANNQTGASSYFASSTLSNAQAGDYILNKDVSFNLKSGSEPAYIRAKYTATLNANKNLFNMGSASNYTAVLGNKNSLAVSGNTLSFTSAGGGSPGILNNDIHEYTTGTAYTLSRSSGTRYLLRILDSNKENITAGTISISGWEWNQWYKCYFAYSSPATFSFSDASVKYFQIGFATNQNAGIVEQYTNVQLELGTTATSYVDCAPSEKNLWNPDADFSDVTLYPSGNGYYGHRLELKPNTKYTISCATNARANYILASVNDYYHPSGNANAGYATGWLCHITSDGLNISSTVSRTLTTGADGYMWINIAGGNTANNFATIMKNAFTNLQIEEGTTATSYEPYTSTHYEDQALANYFKYRNLGLGSNILSLEGRTFGTSYGGNNETKRTLTGNQILLDVSANNYWRGTAVTDYTIGKDYLTATCKYAYYGVAFDYLTSPGQTYSLTWTGSTGSEVRASFYGSDGTYLDMLGLTSGTAFTVPANAYGMLIDFIPTANNTTINISNIKLLKAHDYFQTEDVVSSIGSVAQYAVKTTVDKNYVITQTGSSTNSGGYSQFIVHLPKGTYNIDLQMLTSDVTTTNNLYLWKGANAGGTVFGNSNFDASVSRSFTITDEADYYLAIYGKLTQGQTKTYSVSIKRTDNLDTEYIWSEKIGDYYYLLDATTGAPLEVSDSAKTYTFITKESSKIADNTFFGNVSGNSVKLTISIEAIQVANIDKLDQSKTILQNITTALNEIYNVEIPTATYGVTFVIDKTSYSQSGIAYGGDATLDSTVLAKINSDDFGGFAFYEGGYPVITKSSSGHSWLDLTNGKLKNITENLTLYAAKKVSEAQEYTVTFKNGSTTLQTGKASTGNCYYFGAVPTKDATNTKYYEFAGWKKSGETTVYTDLSEVTISADTTFEAVFNEINRTFDIAFDLNEGYFLSSASVPTSYSYGSKTTLPTAEMLSKPGYAFAGWFENADFSGTAVTEISATTVGNKTYYAKWTAPTLTLNLAGGGMTEIHLA